MTRSPLSNKTPPDDDGQRPPSKFRIQKKRLGRIKTVLPEKEFGFIESDDFRDDVFFHFSAWDAPNDECFYLDSYVEFELDDEQYETKQRLRARVFRPTNRPDGRKLSGRDATFDLVQHHPNAQRKRPTWRPSS
ncbi:MAG: cold shock domain-containing protein [Planctomycetota bacterium]